MSKWTEAQQTYLSRLPVDAVAFFHQHPELLPREPLPVAAPVLFDEEWYGQGNYYRMSIERDTDGFYWFSETSVPAHEPPWKRFWGAPTLRGWAEPDVYTPPTQPLKITHHPPPATPDTPGKVNLGILSFE